ncbi:HEAT repeat domain-containing protein [Nakamurella leprariae]|uniref:HEAT repeat domain-containing protein n=1 Tax=Nakamurella leprariae TaxID=2803911 RepID=UPI001F4842CC|nr:hypothetical protein [Nakamurella leprariae]
MDTTSLQQALAAPQASTRLQAALAAGSRPDPAQIDLLVEQCAVEPDFFVRDMLTWALTRQPATLTVPRLVRQLDRDRAQARSQALHTLSKIGDPVAWPAITPALLQDPDDEVARAAWRTAVVLAPEQARTELAERLVGQLGRGSRDVRRSLSRALAALGDVARAPVATAAQSPVDAVRTHAAATRRLLDDPEADFADGRQDARRIIALDGAPADGPDDASGADGDPSAPS